MRRGAPLTRDGREILTNLGSRRPLPVSPPTHGGYYPWRVSAGEAPAALPACTAPPNPPSHTTAATCRLTLFRRANIWRVAAKVPGRRTMISSTYYDSSPSFSPDRKHVFSAPTLGLS